MEFKIISKRNPLWIDPRTKFFMLIFIGVFSLTVPTPPIPVEILVFLMPLLFILAYGMISTVIKSGIVFAILLCIQVIIRPNITSGYGVFILSIFGIIRMFFPIGVTAILLIRTTTVSEFLSAFRKLHLPDAFIIPVSVMFRFIPTITEEWKSISSAMRFRGIGVNLKNILTKPMLTLEYMLVPLLMSTSTISEELAAASLSRGLDIGIKRTSIKEVYLGVVDYILLCFMLSLSIAMGVGIL